MPAAPAATEAQDRFAEVFGTGRGGGRKGLARFSAHHRHDRLYEGCDVVAAITSFAEEAGKEAALIQRCAEDGWSMRVAKVGGNSFVSVTKGFTSGRKAAQELKDLGADDLTVDFFPSGSPQERDGAEAWSILQDEVVCHKKVRARDLIQVTREQEASVA